MQKKVVQAILHAHDALSEWLIGAKKRWQSGTFRKHRQKER
jgi:hypothetical protein